MNRLSIAVAIIAPTFVLAALLPGASAQVLSWQGADRESVLYEPPVVAEVFDPFRPPAHIGAPGNRGLEYANSQGLIVAAAASGSVSFAGPVAGRNVITIEHADGVRTTYSGLSEFWVRSGDYSNQGSAIAVATTGFHFGARIRDHYLDPQVLLDASQGDERARLVPAPD